MTKALNPHGVHPPQAAYNHTMAINPGARWLVISGQLGIDTQGQVAAGALAQTEQIFANIQACLRAHGMDKRDLVKLTTYLTDARFVPEMRRARDAFFGDMTPPTSTLLIVAGLADPDYLVEIEAWAAKD